MKQRMCWGRGHSVIDSRRRPIAASLQVQVDALSVGPRPQVSRLPRNCWFKNTIFENQYIIVKNRKLKWSLLLCSFNPEAELFDRTLKTLLKQFLPLTFHIYSDSQLWISVIVFVICLSSFPSVIHLRLRKNCHLNQIKSERGGETVG